MIGCRVELKQGSEEAIPSLKLLLPEERLGLTAMDAVVQLQAGSNGRPAVATKPPNIAEGSIEFGPVCLRPGDPAVVVVAVRDIVESAALAAKITAVEATSVLEQ